MTDTYVALGSWRAHERESPFHGTGCVCILCILVPLSGIMNVDDDKEKKSKPTKRFELGIKASMVHARGGPWP